MMRHSPFLCSPSHIRARANTELRERLDWNDIHAWFTTDTIVRVLWLMATRKASLPHIAQRFVWPVGETTRRAGIAGQLPDPGTLAAAFHRRFLALLPRVPTKGFVVAIDTHGSCYYGHRARRGPSTANARTAPAGTSSPPRRSSWRRAGGTRSRRPRRSRAARWMR